MSAAVAPELKQSDKQYLAELQNREMLFCLNCGSCAEQCVEKLPVADIMRAYMYTYGYKQPSLSKQTLAELNLPASICSCESCKVTCKAGFDVARKIAAISPVMQVPDRFLA